MNSVRSINPSGLKSVGDGEMPANRGGILVLPAAGSHRNVPHGAASGPVPLAALAEMARLIDVVVIVVAEFRVHAVTARAGENFVRLLQWFLL